MNNRKKVPVSDGELDVFVSYDKEPWGFDEPVVAVSLVENDPDRGYAEVCYAEVCMTPGEAVFLAERLLKAARKAL